MKSASRGRGTQSGSVLLEALIAILIFSMGILSVVAMQNAALKTSGSAKYRADAALLANELIGQMWVSDRTAATLATRFAGSAGTGGTGYTSWLGNVQGALPGADTNPPSVVVNNATGFVTVTVYWKLPAEASGDPVHNYVLVAQVQ